MRFLLLGNCDQPPPQIMWEACQPPKLGLRTVTCDGGNAPRVSVRRCRLTQRTKRPASCTQCKGWKAGSDTEPEFTTNVQFVQVMSGSNRRDWTPAFPDDHSHDGMKRDSRYYYPRNHLL